MSNKDNSLTVPFLQTHKLDPENQETPLRFLREWITPIDSFYLRNHFSYPEINNTNLFLTIGGEVNNTLILHLDQLRQMPCKSLLIPLECSGNKRAFFDPKVYGTQWETGAMSQGVWKGVSLGLLLKQAGIKNNAKEVVFVGHDHGTRPNLKGEHYFARSLPMDIALHQDTLVAYELNGEPIPYKHGFPLRLVVPGWYGMAWVKWLKSITVISGKFTGPFQAIDYNYYPNKNSDRGKHPVTFKNVNSTIIHPLNLANIERKRLLIEGIAWSGKRTISEVEISTDNGKTWDKANISRYPQQSFAWVYWSYIWMPAMKGEYTIMSKAKDSNGCTQPLDPYWNRKGYGYNAVSKVKVQVN